MQFATPVAFLLLLCGGTMAQNTVPPAVVTDPPRDKAHPATIVVAAIRSGEATMNGVLYVAGGAGPHPTLLLLHGLPGNEQNLDLAQAVRRAGWNVLTMHYRGSWGSGGTFSFAHAAEDVRAALAWLRTPANATAGRVDPARVAVAGHSFGGLLAAQVGTLDPELVGVAMISPWNLGGFAAWARSKGDEGRRKFVRAMAGNQESLVGCTPDGLADEALASGDRWNLLGYATGLVRAPLLLVSAADGNEVAAGALVAAVRAAGGKAVTDVAIDADHSFSDRRIELAAAVVRWLQALPQPPKSK
jgi:acetyl esterase/lipase